jgi:hypothetical protein
MRTACPWQLAWPCADWTREDENSRAFMIRINLLRQSSRQSPREALDHSGGSAWITRREAWTGILLLASAVAILFYLAERRTVRVPAPVQSGEPKDAGKSFAKSEAAAQSPIPARGAEMENQSKAPGAPSPAPAPSSSGASEAASAPPASLDGHSLRAFSSAPSGERSSEAAGQPGGEFHLNQVSLIRERDGLTVALGIEPGAKYQTMTLAHPNRVVIDFLNCRLTVPPPYSRPLDTPPVKRLRISQFQLEPPITRLVLDADTIPQYRIQPSSTGIEIHMTGGSL